MGFWEDLERTFVPEKAKEFFHKPVRTLERSFVPENKLARTAINVGLGAVPVVGPALATGYGLLSATKDIPEGTKFGKQIIPLAKGAVSGYMQGAAGAGIAGGVEGMATEGMGGFVSGAKEGAGAYLGAEGAGGLWGVGEKVIGVGQKLLGGTTGAGATIGPKGYVGAGSAADPLAAGGGGFLQTAGGFLKNLTKWGGGPLALGAGVLGSQAKKPPELTYDPEKYLTEAKEFAEKYDMGGMPKYAQQEVQKMVETPLRELYPVEVEGMFARQEREITEEWDRYEAARQREFVKANALNSSDWRDEKLRIQELRSRQLEEARRQTEYDVLDKSISMKTWAITQAASNGQFEFNAVMELASLVAKEDEIRNAILSDDYESYQNIMGQLMSMGAQEVLDMGGDLLQGKARA